MDTKVYGYFLAVCRAKSFVRAAAELHISPQGLNSSMRRFESELGVPLFDMSSGGVNLTEYGRLVYDVAREVDASLAGLHRGIDTLRAHADNVVKLGCSVGLLGYLGEDVFEGLAKIDGAPQVLVTDELPDLELEQRLLDGDFDFGLLVGPASAELASVAVVEDYQFFWVNARSPLARRSEIRLADLEGQTVATVGESFRNPGRFVRLCEDAGVRVDLRFTCEMMRVYELARAGVALGLTCRNHIEDTRESSRTVGVPFKALPWGFSLCYRRDRALTEAEGVFADYLRARRRTYR